MKYRLRTLFAAILLAGIVSAVLARMQYYASRASLHERKGQEYSAKLMELRRESGNHGESFDLNEVLPDEQSTAQKRYFQLIQHHARLMQEYRYATYRPWLIVEEPAEPVETP